MSDIRDDCPLQTCKFEVASEVENNCGGNMHKTTSCKHCGHTFTEPLGRPKKASPKRKKKAEHDLDS